MAKKNVKSEGKTAPTASHVTEDMLTMVQQIQELVKVRSALSFGTTTDVRRRAESVMSRTISKEVDALSKLILQKIKEEF